MPELISPPNIYGVETEYTCMLEFPGDKVYEIVGKCHSVDERIGLYVAPESKGSDHIAATIFGSAVEGTGLSITSTGMLSNGGRLYIDPSGPEYATPETTTAEEAVHRTFDGDDIVLSVFEKLRDIGVLQGSQVNRRIVDHNRKSRGIHLNTTTRLPVAEPSVDEKEALATLNVVKGAIFGSGGLLVDDEGRTAYHHSPRLSITSALSAKYQSYTERPLVRYPFKPDVSGLARIETVTSDALNFAWPLRASLVVTNALIRILERGVAEEIPVLRNPIDAALIVGRYGNSNHISVNRESGYNGEKPLNILNEICEIILVANDDMEILDDEALQVLPEIIDVIDRMAVDEELVATQVESVARKLAMRKKMERDKLTLDSERMCRFDYAWDWIGGSGIAESLRRKNLVGWQGFTTKHSPSASKKRRNIPPQDTRAKVRGNAIKDSGGDNDIDWTGTNDVKIGPSTTSSIFI